MAILRPQSEFPTWLFKVTMVFLSGLLIGGGAMYWYAKTYPLAFVPAETSTASDKTATIPTKKTDSTSDWVAFSSTKGKFSGKNPPTWVQPDHRELCNEDFFDRAVYLGPDTNSVLKCASEFFGQISISSVAGNKVSANLLDSDVYTGITTETVTVNGVSGKRQVGTAKASDQPFSPAVGTKQVIYVFFTNGNTYVATYTQAPKTSDNMTANVKDVLSDFDLMIKTTLKFEA